MNLKKNLSISLDKNNTSPFSPNQTNFSTEILPLKPEKVLEKFPQEELDACWDALCINVIQNYQRGKGTFIKNFGTFTYKNPEINLEGTTNEVFRDKKLRSPIFIVSKEFNPNVKPGEFNPIAGIRYYIAKENKNISILRLNYAEIAFSLSMTRDKVNSIIKCLIFYINESIEKKTFKNKKMGLLGDLILNPTHNILAVKFNPNFEESILDKNRLLNNIKSKVSLNRNLENAKNLNLGNFPNIYNISEKLKARNSLVTECQPSAKKFLNDNYYITIDDNDDINSFHKKRNFLCTSTNTNRFFTQRKKYPFNFINDSNNNNKSNKNYSTPKSPIKNEEDKEKESNPLSKLENNILKKMSFLKGSLIRDAKELDVNKRGSITEEKAIYMLLKNIPELKYDLAKEIIEHYFNTDQIDYMKLIALLIKGSKNSFLKKKGFIDFTNYLFKNTNINFSYKKFNFKDVINRQKSKKNSIIKEAQKNYEKLNELKQMEKEKKFSAEKPIFYKEQKCIEKNAKELYFLSDIVPQLKQRFSTMLNQKINLEEFLRILKEYYEIYYQKDDLEEMLKFIEIKDIKNFSLQEFIDKINLCKLIDENNDLSQFNKVLKKISDVVYMNGGEKFLFDNDINKNKDTLDVNTFIKLLKNKNSLDEKSLRSAFYYIVKTSRNMTKIL